MKEKTVEKKPLLARFMDGVETVCNKLPPPTNSLYSASSASVS